MSYVLMKTTTGLIAPEGWTAGLIAEEFADRGFEVRRRGAGHGSSCHRQFPYSAVCDAALHAAPWQRLAASSNPCSSAFRSSGSEAYVLRSS
jgi:hypothetical protein